MAARKVYEELSILPPFCWEMHSKMVALECMQPDINLKNVRRCYEIACTQFGKNNTGTVQTIFAIIIIIVKQAHVIMYKNLGK